MVNVWFSQPSPAQVRADLATSQVQAAVWEWGETLTIEYEGDALVQYPVTYEADGHHLREVGEPRLYATGRAAPQPFLSPLEEVVWHPARRLSPYRPRRKRVEGRPQKRPLDPTAREASAG
jgi:hypothetical protein